MPNPTRSASIAVLAAALIAGSSARGAGVSLEGRTVRGPKQTVEIAKTGLPAQWRIAAAEHELPLEWRRKDKSPSESELVALGRGPQLHSPIRLQAIVGGSTVTAEAQKPAALEAADGAVEAQATLKAGEVPIELTARYEPTGHVRIRLTFGGNGTKVARLGVVVAPRGPVDTAFVGPALAGAPRTYRPAEFALPGGNGPVWANTGENVPEKGRDRPGLVEHVFVGSGDRGFSFRPEKTGGFAIDDGKPMTRIVREDNGRLRWYVDVINHETTLEKKRTVAFSLRLQPAQTRPPEGRRKAWLDGDAKLPGATEAKPGAGMVALAGPAGEAASGARLVTETLPLRLHRYLAGSHAGRWAQLRTNARAKTNPGGDPAPDRAAIGRGLLLDMGVAASGIAGLERLREVVEALHAFGVFKGDGATEFVPPWRSGALVRYGPERKGEDGASAFALKKEGTASLRRTHVSVFRRPMEGSDATRALIAVVNEGDKHLRKQLYIRNPKRVFGTSSNAVTFKRVEKRWDMSHIPDDSDWANIPHEKRENAKKLDTTVLRDVISKGYVQRATKAEEMAVYGPLFVPAHGYRILYGEGRP